MKKLKKYPEGDYVSPTMPDLRHPGEKNAPKLVDKIKEVEKSKKKGKELIDLEELKKRQKLQSIQPTPAPQGYGSKTWEALTHPMTAIGYKLTKQRLPDNFSKGETNPLDVPANVLNPAFYVDEAKNTGVDLYNGNYSDAALHALNLLPALSESKAITKGLKNTGKYLTEETALKNEIIPSYGRSTSENKKYIWKQLTNENGEATELVPFNNETKKTVQQEHIDNLKEYYNSKAFNEKMDNNYPNVNKELYKEKTLQNLEEPLYYSTEPSDMDALGFYRKKHSTEGVYMPGYTPTFQQKVLNANTNKNYKNFSSGSGISKVQDMGAVHHELNHQSVNSDELLPDWLTQEELHKNKLISLTNDELTEGKYNFNNYYSKPQEFDVRIKQLRQDLKSAKIKDYFNTNDFNVDDINNLIELDHNPKEFQDFSKIHKKWKNKEITNEEYNLAKRNYDETESINRLHSDTKDLLKYYQKEFLAKALQILPSVSLPLVGTQLLNKEEQQKENGGTITMAKNGIHIKSENKGKFNATKKATGKTTEELTHSKNPITRKRAVFAQNASHWRKAEDGDQIQPLNQPQQFQQNGQFQSQWDVNQTPPNLPGSPSYLEPLTYIQPKKKKNWWEQPDDSTVEAPQDNTPLQPIQPNQGLPNPSTGLPSQFKTEDYDQVGYKAPDEFSPITPGPKKSLRNTQMKMNLGLAVLDNLIPDVQPKSNKAPRQGQVQTAPLQYGAPINNNQGIGQTAISKNGKTLEKYPEGGSVKKEPIITNNPNDPRLKAYNDSLNLYNFNKNAYESYPGVNQSHLRYEDLKNGRNYGQEFYMPAGKYSKEPLKIVKKPVQPVVYQKEQTRPKPGKGKIIPIEHPSLQQGQTNQNFDRNISPIDVKEQPTNWSFHYPMEGTFDKANPQGVKYFKDRQEWQKFLDENDYNSAEEKNGVGQASGTLKMYNGGNMYAEQGLQVENDAYTPLSPSTYMLDGKSHAEGGTNISYGSNPVEAEKGEPIAINDENNLVIFGNRKPKENPIIKQHVKELGFNPNSKYKSLVKEIGVQEGKQQTLMNQASQLLENNSPDDKWDSLSFNSGKAMLIGSNQELENLNMKKNSLGKLQEIQNAFFPDKKAKNGKTIKAGDGLTDYIRKPGDGLTDYIRKPKEDKGTDYSFGVPGITRATPEGKKITSITNDKTFQHQHLDPKTGLYGGMTPEKFEEFKKANSHYNWEGVDYKKPGEARKFQNFHNRLLHENNIFDQDVTEDDKWGTQTLSPRIQFGDITSTTPTVGNNPNVDITFPGWNKWEVPQTKKEETNTFNFDTNYKKKPFQKGKYDYLNDIGEIQALTYNPQAVNYSTLQPHLDQPYNVSFQDRRNQVQSNLRASNQAIGDNPAAQATLMGQANEQLQPINGEEFRTNQGIYAGTLASNNQKLDNVAAFNARQYDAMSENAAANKFNKFATTKAALQSMGQKHLQFDQGQNELEAFSNALSNYNINSNENNVDYTGADPNVLHNLFGGFTNRRNNVTTKEKTKEGNKTTEVITSPKTNKNGGTHKMSHSRMMKLM